MKTGIILSGRTQPARYSALKADLVYLGSEFCQNLLPRPEDFSRAAKVLKKRVVLVTPFLTDRCFGGIEKIIRAHSGGEKLEIVANDLGLIHLVGKKYASKVALSLGRVLGNLMKSSSAGFMTGFLAGHGITRAEADSPEQADRCARFGGVACTYHIPYSYVAFTRFCPWEKHWVQESCGYTCQAGGKKLTSKLLPRPLLLMNCGYFTDGGKPARNANIDRVVYQPSVQ